jgi:phospholipid/cholesterol/gamma-HCH transport system substrate-binding protein
MVRARRHRVANLEHRSLLAGAIAVLLLVVAGMGAPRNWWSRNLELSFRTYSAAGLRPGMPVMISGYPVGRVLRIRLLSDAQVQVTLLVGAAQEPMIGRRSRASLAQDSLLGSPYIAITPDLTDLGQRAAVANGETLIYEPSPGLANLIRELAASRLPLEEVLSSTARLMEQRLPRSLDQLDRTLESGDRLAGGIERELVGRSGSLQTRIEGATANLERTLGSVEATLSDIQALARSSNSLLQGISRSWLLRLLDRAPATPGPAAPAAEPAPGAAP